ncbi:MAG: DUF2339 domain-containing protein [Treponema sp.]|jgi:uncharacterized membrane protein|nr:DUF2339 domain-containing protein [Treponema sp.]
MQTAENLRNIAVRQKELAERIETECRVLEESDLARENSSLKTELAKIRADFEKLSAESSAVTSENASLKNALYEHVFNEKNNIINNTVQKLDIYFRAETEGELNKLTAIEQDIKARIKRVKEYLAQDVVDTREEFDLKMDELSELLDKRITESQARAAQAGAFSETEREQLNALKNSEITDEQIRAVAKKNNLERFVGLNVLNVIGIFLLFAGAVTAMRYSYLKLPDLFKGIMIFALGGIMLVIGEVLNRKKPNVFSLGISAGGIAILYAALAISFFFLHILGMYPAIAVCVLLTVGAFVLSNRYNSQVIAAFALIGGYLPIILIDSGIAFVYGAMVYFTVLNIFALAVSWKCKWRITEFIGLSLNIAGAVYICLFPDSVRINEYYFNMVGFPGGVLDKTLTIIYAVFSFLIYTAIPVAGAYRAKLNFKKSDIVLLAVNTVFSGLIMYGVFSRYGLEDYDGFLAIAFAVFYLLLGKFIEKKFPVEERHTKALFYLTALAFVVLIIPMQFGLVWLSLGWLAEGVILAVYGVIKSEKNFRKAGLVICALCLGAFLIFDLSSSWRYLFVWKYSAITLGSLIILGAYMYKKMMNGSFVSVYKYFAVINTWFYALYIIGRTGDNLSHAYASGQVFNITYLTSAASITATFFIAFIISRIKLLSVTGKNILSITLYCIGIIWLFAINGLYSPVALAYFRTTTPEPGVTIMGTVILAVLGLLSILSIREIMKLVVIERKKGIEWLPLIVSGYFVILLSQNLIAQFNLNFSSVAISVIYALAALAWIIFGFVRRFVFIRRFGLVLAIFAVVKLFLLDLAGLSQGLRIVSYFALGLSLIAISFVYQYFSKRLELKEGMSIHDEKN